MQYNAAQVDLELTSLRRDAETSRREFDEAIRGEASERAANLHAVHSRLEDLAVGNVSTLLFGAGWLTVGSVISALAPEIARLVAGQWRVVWLAL
jgi:hypothetical protein